MQAHILLKLRTISCYYVGAFGMQWAFLIMNFIKTIKDAEQTAHDMEVHAHEESKTLIDGAHASQEQALHKHTESLSEKRSQKITEQREELKATYKDILARGIAEAERVSSRAHGKSKDALTFIMKRL